MSTVRSDSDISTAEIIYGIPLGDIAIELYGGALALQSCLTAHSCGLKPHNPPPLTLCLCQNHRPILAAGQLLLLAD